MQVFAACAALVLLLSLAAGLLRIVHGPRGGDRMLAAQLFGTTGVATLLLLGEATQEPRLLDVALAFALLSMIAAVAFVRGRNAVLRERGRR